MIRQKHIADVIWDEGMKRHGRMMVDTQAVMLSKMLHPYPLIPNKQQYLYCPSDHTDTVSIH